MLHRKLLLMLGPPVALLLIMSVTATLLLSGVLEDLTLVSQSSLHRTAGIEAIGATLTTIEGELVLLRLEPVAPRDRLRDAAATIRVQVNALDRDADPWLADAEVTPPVHAALDRLMHRIDAIDTAVDPQEAAAQATLAGSDAIALRKSIVDTGRAAGADIVRRHEAGMTRFRRTVLVVCLAFLVVLNVSIIALLRAASMILQPVGQLVEASRHLAREEFEYRAPEDRDDEFGELARATNQMAEQLCHNEVRKVETLHQVARTLNHELRNAIAIIEVQLELVARRSGRDEAQGDRLRQIRETMERMTGTVDALTRVRRIVLTDYVPGLKMLDLERSVEVEPSSSAIATGVTAETKSA